MCKGYKVNKQDRYGKHSMWRETWQEKINRQTRKQAKTKGHKHEGKQMNKKEVNQAKRQTKGGVHEGQM